MQDFTHWAFGQRLSQWISEEDEGAGGRHLWSSPEQVIEFDMDVKLCLTPGGHNINMRWTELFTSMKGENLCMTAGWGVGGVHLIPDLMEDTLTASHDSETMLIVNCMMYIRAMLRWGLVPPRSHDVVKGFTVELMTPPARVHLMWCWLTCVLQNIIVWWCKCS